ncbi:MAG: hypothetical protein BMS9Abin26_0801 [Gammaproteobacteria bacterium]|nr:MAG: hypothetical protein BMS9Abin26_0801 [Gammaproteobacteria bacterium]
MNTLTHILTISLLALAMLGTANAGQVYKWHDAAGNVHYTATPPPDTAIDIDKAATEFSTGAVIKVTKKGRYSYCGSKRLPESYYSNRRTLNTIDYKYDDWQKARDNLKKTLAKSRLRLLKEKARMSDYRRKYGKQYNRYYTDDYQVTAIKRMSKEIRTYDCMISWANEKRNSRKNQQQRLAKEKNNLAGEYEKVVYQRDQQCGARPQGFGKTTENWYDCVREFDNVIHQTVRGIDVADEETRELSRDSNYEKYYRKYRYPSRYY